MGETADVLAALARARRDGRPASLATIVGVRGSTYRRPGARLLVYESGPSRGNLSGGCLEGEVETLGREIMSGDGGSRLVTYDLTADDEAVWGWGLGCNGVIEVFVEPAAAAAELAEAMGSAVEHQRSVAVVTVIDSEDESVATGTRLLVHPDGSVQGDAPEEIAKVLERSALEALSDGTTRTVNAAVSGAGVRLFVEVIEPPPRLLVCGAGHDAIPVVAAAARMGWRVLVLDDRAGLLEEARFPEASGFVNVQPGALAQAIELDERTYAVVMSHNFLRDRAYLGSFLGTPIAYVGMLGPGARLQRLLDGLAEDGVRATEDDLAKLHGPAGLDLGSEGPEEVAVALVAELLALHSGRAGGFLRDRAGPIHERNRLRAVARGG